ncbi:MAG: TIGR02679 domain-containing protein [Acidimicrobiia bacterium]|nr:TIGR02679 domain-containing protein [Acidimicrobiia bacterium]
MNQPDGRSGPSSRPDDVLGAAGAAPDEQLDATRTLLGDPALERLWARVRAALDRTGGAVSGTVTLSSPSEDERRAVGRVLGRHSRARNVRVDLARLDDALRRSPLGEGLVAWITERGGPLEDRPAARCPRRGPPRRARPSRRHQRPRGRGLVRRVDRRPAARGAPRAAGRIVRRRAAHRGHRGARAPAHRRGVDRGAGEHRDR